MFAQESDKYWNAETIKPFTSFLKAGIATGKTGVMEGQFWGPNKYPAWCRARTCGWTRQHAHPQG